MDSEHAVQVSDGPTHQLVFDLQPDHVVAHRVAGGKGAQDLFVVLARVADVTVPVARPPGNERVSVPDDRVDFQRRQIPVDADQLLVENETEDGEMRLDAKHAEVLHVHRGDHHDRAPGHVEQDPQAQRVHRYDQQRAAQHHQLRRPLERGRLGRGHRRVRVKPVDSLLVRRQRAAALRDDRQPRRQGDQRHHPGVHALHHRGQRAVAVTLQRAHGLWRVVEHVHAGRYQRRGVNGLPRAGTGRADDAEDVPNENRPSRYRTEHGQTCVAAFSEAVNATVCIY